MRGAALAPVLLVRLADRTRCGCQASAEQLVVNRGCRAKLDRCASSVGSSSIRVAETGLLQAMDLATCQLP
jgi:hypothetical protein